MGNCIVRQPVTNRTTRTPFTALPTTRSAAVPAAASARLPASTKSTDGSRDKSASSKRGLPPAPPEATVTPAEQRVLALLLERFGTRASRYMCVQIMRSADLVPCGRGDAARAREWADGAAVIIERILAWREAHQVDGLATRPVERARFDAMWPDAVSGSDRYGRPVHWQRIGQIPADEVTKAFTAEQVLLWHAQSTERAREACLERCRQGGLDFVGQVEVLDLTGFNHAHFGVRFLKLLREVMDADFKYYDGMMSAMVVINVPWLFAQMWRLIAPLLDDETKQKISLCDAKASLRKLAELGVSADDRMPGIVLREEAAVLQPGPRDSRQVGPSAGRPST